MSSLKDIIWKYYDEVIPINQWKWVSLSKEKEIYFLFVNKNQIILSVYPFDKYNLKYYMMGGHYVYISNSLMENYVDIFDKSNYDLCCEILIKWIEKNIPLIVNETDYIGGIKRK